MARPDYAPLTRTAATVWCVSYKSGIEVTNAQTKSAWTLDVSPAIKHPICDPDNYFGDPHSDNYRHWLHGMTRKWFCSGWNDCH